MTLHCHLTKKCHLIVTILPMRTSLKSSTQFSSATLVLRRRSQCQTLVTLRLLWSRYSSFISSGTTLRLGANFLSMMSTTQKKPLIGTNADTWRRKIRKLEISMLRKKDQGSLNSVRSAIKKTLESRSSRKKKKTKR